jgi:glycosyltransferase involved in cell wall biosynthesis
MMMPLAAVVSLTDKVADKDPDLPASSVSVIIPARNAAATIARTLRSLAPDAGLIGEVILVDDGSTDQTMATAKSISKTFELPIRVISAQAGSAGAARNLGLEAASGEFIYFVDSDDEPLPGCLHRLVEALASQADRGIAIGANIRRTAGRVDKRKSPSGFANDMVVNAEAYLRNQILPIAMGSAVVRRSAIGPARFPEKAGLDEDTIFWAAVRGCRQRSASYKRCPRQTRRIWSWHRCPGMAQSLDLATDRARTGPCRPPFGSRALFEACGG